MSNDTVVIEKEIYSKMLLAMTSLRFELQQMSTNIDNITITNAKDLLQLTDALGKLMTIPFLDNPQLFEEMVASTNQTLRRVGL